MKSIIKLSVVCLIVLSINSCKKEEQQTSSITIKLKDAPATAFQEVNVEVIGVQIHSNVSGRVSLNVNDSIYDLLLLQNNSNAVLSTMTLPSATVSQVRLILGTHNTVKVNNVIYPLSLSSQDESGLKLNIHQTLVANQTYTLMLDFIASQSVIQNGNGTYKLKPVLNAAFN
ncbi:MAG: DUF4382 domain-containing protein [Bacteroidia bacterium]|nr:DUF4382 domain-containing protein [Bacteroidia bacterium]